MPYQIVDPVMAQSIQADVARAYARFARVVMQDVPEFPSTFVARLVTERLMVGYPLASSSVDATATTVVPR